MNIKTVLELSRMTYDDLTEYFAELLKERTKLASRSNEVDITIDRLIWARRELLYKKDIE